MLTVSNLKKNFGSIQAVKGVSFTVEKGEVLGFLGPNGAGKSTTMRMITGFIPPSAGTATICGHDITTDPVAAKKCIGYLPENAPSYHTMTMTSFLTFIGQVRGFEGRALAEKVESAICRSRLEQVRNQTIETLSKGYRQRTCFAQAILHDPQVLILDEPTDGLDPNQKHQVRQLIQGLAKDKIVIISTHILEEVSAVCTRAVIIAGGKLVADGTPFDLESRSRYHQAVTLVGADALDEAALAALPGVAGVERNEREHSLTVLAQPGAVIFSAVNELIRERGWSIKELDVERGRLDEVFRTLTRGAAQ